MLGAALAAERYDRVLAVLAPAMIVSQYILYALCHRLIRPKLNADAIKHHGSNGEMTAASWSQLWKDMSGYVWCCCFHIAFSTVAMYGAGSYVFGDATPERSALGGAHTSMCSSAQHHHQDAHFAARYSSPSPSQDSATSRRCLYRATQTFFDCKRRLDCSARSLQR